MTELAIANLTNRDQLIAALVQVRVDAGMAVEDVAEDCGCDVEYIERFESSDYDPTMSELRYYAVSVGAVIDYNVTHLDGSDK